MEKPTGDTRTATDTEKVLWNLTDRELLSIVHALEQARVQTAFYTGQRPLDLGWPEHYQELVAEAQRRNLCL